MRSSLADGDVEYDVKKIVLESSEERRRRLNRERMRRNRSNPTYREREQRRQRERRRERLLASKMAKVAARTHQPVSLMPQFSQREMQIPQPSLPWPREMPDASCCAAQTPYVVALPMDGYSRGFLPPSALCMLPGISLLVVAEDAVQPQRPGVHVGSMFPPSLNVKKPVHLSKNLNLDSSGGFWYSNAIPNQDESFVRRDGPVIKREY